MRAVLSILVVAALAGCASSSGVFKTGPETYGITTTAITSFGGAGKASSEAVKTANKFCTQMGKQAEITETNSDSQITQGSTNMTFKCVPQE